MIFKFSGHSLSNTLKLSLNCRKLGTIEISPQIFQFFREDIVSFCITRVRVERRVENGSAQLRWDDL
jgi:hypothetical protein